MVTLILALSCQICSMELADSLCPMLLWWAQVLAEFHVVSLYLAVITVVFSMSDRSSLWEWLIMPGTTFHLSTLLMISRSASLSPFLSTKIHVIYVEGVCYPRVQSSVVIKLRVNLLYLLQLSNSQFTNLQNGAKDPQSLQDLIDLHLWHTIVSQEKSILFQRQISFHRN